MRTAGQATCVVPGVRSGGRRPLPLSFTRGFSAGTEACSDDNDCWPHEKQTPHETQRDLCCSRDAILAARLVSSGIVAAFLVAIRTQMFASQHLRHDLADPLFECRAVKKDVQAMTLA